MGSLICEDSFLSVDGASPNAVWADSAPDGLLKWLPPEAPSHGQKRRILFGTSLALTKAPDSLHLVWKDCLPEETAEEAEDFDVVAHTEDDTTTRLCFRHVPTGLWLGKGPENEAMLVPEAEAVKTSYKEAPAAIDPAFVRAVLDDSVAEHGASLASEDAAVLMSSAEKDAALSGPSEHAELEPEQEQEQEHGQKAA
uniref:Uncharacterized protein n=1 Tax=Pinguiococcus pyrenoidosus TaxID=172671 RepID=A0A7R9UCK9_9STRA|mmetsp:Transcript_3842/g.14952  ORF Transcript_3842/g.14952 Transcript_3842/m.14952 type:complete len:197 (+) Transcript_3842:22-612(+)